MLNEDDESEKLPEIKIENKVSDFCNQSDTAEDPIK